MKTEPVRKKKIITCDMRVQYPIDGVAKSVFENIEGRVSNALYQDMMDYLLGFNDDCNWRLRTIFWMPSAMVGNTTSASLTSIPR